MSLLNHLKALTNKFKKLTTEENNNNDIGIKSSAQYIGKYKLIKHLGSGGFGEVWLGEINDQGKIHQAALKITSKTYTNQQINQEISVWKKACGHPNIVPIIKTFQDDDRTVIVSQYIASGSLNDKIKKIGKIPLEDSIRIITGILEGLEFLHRRSIIHSDLKPDNVLLHDSTPRLTDFGISKILNTQATSHLSENIAGTFSYMSPESFDGTYSKQSDIWSVGIIFYQLLTGKMPFTSEKQSIIRAITFDTPNFDESEIPEFLKKVISKSLSKRREDRYQTATEMIKAIENSAPDNEVVTQIVNKAADQQKAAETSDLSFITQVRKNEVLPPSEMSSLFSDASSLLESLKQRKMVEPQVETEESISAPSPAKSEPQNFGNYVVPTSEFLNPAQQRIEQKDEILLAVAQELMETLGDFKVRGAVKHISPGPVVTTYEFKPDPGVKYSRITGLADDLCLALKAESIRIDRIPGKAHVGIEVPNQDRETIFLREVIESKKFQSSESKLTVALGKSIDGLNYVADLAKMPHLLIAGATGAGKSVGVNTLIVSILYKARPDEVKFIMVDPKQVELGIYGDIPHLATPIIADPKRAAISLKWAVSEMERRYKDLAGFGVRNLEGYNQEVKKRNDAEQFDNNGEPWKKLPFIVIVIDSLQDLTITGNAEIEDSIAALARSARAVGIHLIIATQRPDSEVFAGLAKANLLARISYRVFSSRESRIILNQDGAEKLLSRGDMLFLPPETTQIVRVHGALVDDKEITKIVEHIKSQGRPEYDATITRIDEEMDDLSGKRDPLFVDALRTVIQNKGASTSLLQRYLRIGYGRAAEILDVMVREGFIGEMEGSKRARPILEKAYEYLEGYDSAGDL